MSDDVYESRSPGQEIWVQGAEPIYAPGTGILIGRLKELKAEFGRFTPEVPRLNPDGERVLDAYTGEPLTTAVIYGNVFDLQAQAEEKGWTLEETALVKAVVDDHCDRIIPHDVWRRSKAKATAPWPTYDSTHHNQIAPTAKITGTITGALAYERENKNRPFVIKELEDAQQAVQVEEELTVA